MGCGDNGMPRLTSVSVLVSVHADSPVSSCAVPAQPRGVFWSAAGGEGWNAPPSVFSPDDERDAPYSAVLSGFMATSILLVLLLFFLRLHYLAAHSEAPK